MQTNDMTPKSALQRINELPSVISSDLLLFASRIFPAAIFWQSGRTKVDGWSISEDARYLFAEEYKVPLIPPDLAAVLAAAGEHLFPILLVVGLATRASAAALLGMTLVIQVFVYPDAWATHGVWAACLLWILARGPGKYSLDRITGVEK